jgi:hypothetical protein
VLELRKLGEGEGRIVDALAGVLGILFDSVVKFFAGHGREILCKRARPVEGRLEEH